MSDEDQLKNKKCIPCVGGVPPLSGESKKIYLKKINPSWKLTNEDTRLEREVSLKGFLIPLEVSNEIGKLAEDEWHHPDLHISFNKLVIEIWTHKINDLVESDFIFAAKVDDILKRYE